MKSLRRPADRGELRDRLRFVRPDTPRRWGRMTAPQMVCHLTDAFRNLLGERPLTSAAPAPTLVGRTIIKWVALYAPVGWPHGLATRPEADQAIGGTPPGDFARDVRSLEEAMQRFVDAGADGPRRPHYLFGPLTEAQWCRWGWRHMDHHLRQFGA